MELTVVPATSRKPRLGAAFRRQLVRVRDRGGRAGTHNLLASTPEFSALAAHLPELRRGFESVAEPRRSPAAVAS